ncbi:hypothetical protein [Limnohabitans sp. 2KL-17]|uniref:hypothetical protein n=1 Tax=Limnohabitans sp. 2KL-17 TaxID=1100704 RepID=UPI0018EE56EA|nr:hypothetical protein [Limnohabitans sp. 2KL-17]
MSDETDEVFGRAAELFAVLSMSIRLHIISELCRVKNGAAKVGQTMCTRVAVDSAVN